MDKQKEIEKIGGFIFTRSTKSWLIFDKLTIIIVVS